MEFSYVLRDDILLDEEKHIHIVYGITAVDKSGKILKTISDIFFDKELAEEFVALCNSEKVELCHLMDVCEDQLI